MKNLDFPGLEHIGMDKKPYNIVREKVGENFKKFRQQKNLSLREVEAITGIDHSWLSKFEKGKVNFQVDTLLKLASGLKIYIRDLTDFTHDFVDD